MSVDGVFEVAYATTRLARVRANDRESAKRRFAAYVLYDDGTFIDSDVVIASGEDAHVTPSLGSPPVTGSGDEMRAWLKHHDGETEAFDVGLFEDRERAIGAYLQLLAANDPWRLEGHGSFGRRLSSVAMHATLVTFDGRIRYRFDATPYLDYVRLDVLETLDLSNLHESIRIEALVDVSALHDEALRQIASSYETIANEFRLTARFARNTFDGTAFGVEFAAGEWRAYLDHRRTNRERFLPPDGWQRT